MSSSGHQACSRRPYLLSHLVSSEWRFIKDVLNIDFKLKVKRKRHSGKKARPTGGQGVGFCKGAPLR